MKDMAEAIGTIVGDTIERTLRAADTFCEDRNATMGMLAIIFDNLSASADIDKYQLKGDGADVLQ